jgi:tRNA dimethylallyltransferase
MNKIIVIVGPTGVGKTKASVELAKRLNAEIINGDAVSVYKELNIASAKPTLEERSGINHYLLDKVDVCDNYTIYDYQKDARKAIEQIKEKGKNIIVVGGTGLYIKSLLYDYKFHEEEINRYDDLTNDQIISKIKEYGKFDIDYSNRRRIVRLLSKLENNIPLSEKADIIYPSIIIGLTTDRDALYKVINNRVDNMLKNGLLDEINNLKDRYKDSRVLNSAIGYKEFNDYFNDNNIENTVEKIKHNSRKYAKRQFTYFKNQFKTKWFDVSYDNFNKTIDEIYEYIKKEMN